MDQTLSLVLFSGTDDKLQAAAVLTAGAAAIGQAGPPLPAVLGARRVPSRPDRAATTAWRRRPGRRTGAVDPRTGRTG